MLRYKLMLEKAKQALIDYGIPLAIGAMLGYAIVGLIS